MQSKIGKILLYIIYVLIILAGCFAFYKTQLYFYLFNTGNWKMVAENIVISYLEYTGIILLMSFFFQKKDCLTSYVELIKQPF